MISRLKPRVAIYCDRLFKAIYRSSFSPSEKPGNLIILMSMILFILFGHITHISSDNTAISDIAGKEEPLFVTHKDNIIYKLDLKGDTSIAVYESHSDRIFPGRLNVSPNNEYLSFIEINDGEFHSMETKSGGKYDVRPEFYLKIVNKDGLLLHSVSNVYKYIWSPLSDNIAYITYSFEHGDYLERQSTGIWIIEIESGETTRIAEKANEVYWTDHDNCVYYIDYHTSKDSIYKWDPITNATVLTEYKDIYFSPDGNYYLSRGKSECNPLSLYNTADNTKIMAIKVYEGSDCIYKKNDELPQGIGELFGYFNKEYPFGWVPNEEHSLLFIDSEIEFRWVGTRQVKDIKKSTNSIFDVEKRTVIKIFDGVASEWIGNWQTAPVIRDEELIFEDLFIR